VLGIKKLAQDITPDQKSGSRIVGVSICNAKGEVQQTMSNKVARKGVPIKLKKVQRVKEKKSASRRAVWAISSRHLRKGKNRLEDNVSYLRHEESKRKSVKAGVSYPVSGKRFLTGVDNIRGSDQKSNHYGAP